MKNGAERMKNLGDLKNFIENGQILNTQDCVEKTLSLFNGSDTAQQNEIREFLYETRDCLKKTFTGEIDFILQRREFFACEVLKNIQQPCCPRAGNCSKCNCSATEYATLLSMVI